MDISQIHAIVTGGASGIGLATARMLLSAGAAKIAILDQNQQALASLQLLGQPGRVRCLAADVRHPDQVQQATDEFTAWAGPPNLLVACAGVLLDGAITSLSFKGLQQYPPERWDETIGTNLNGIYHCVRSASAAMIRRHSPADGSSRGLIIALSSISRLGRAGQVAYSASKGAIVSMTLSLSQELAPYKIRCVAIAPGLVDTPMAAKIPEIHRAEMLSRVATRRLGQPEEIAHAVRFCIENEFFNGRVLEIDGGAY